MDYSFWIDESVRTPFIVVGGFYAPNESNREILGMWRIIKKEFGLEEDSEIKWKMDENHPTRKRLEELGYPTKALNEAAISKISQCDKITCVVTVLRDLRDIANWRTTWKKSSEVDFYCEAVKYILQNVAEESEEQSWGNTTVVCDTPPLGKKLFRRSSILRGATAHFEAFGDFFSTGVGVGPSGNKSKKSLRELGFQPSLLVGDASHHDMLQIADSIVGCTSEWAKDTLKNEPESTWVTNQFKALSVRFRNRHCKYKFFGDGLTLHPSDRVLWDRLAQSIK